MTAVDVMQPYFQDDRVTIYQGMAQDYLAAIPDESVHCCVTSSDYWQQVDHGVDNQIGLHDMQRYIKELADIFDEVYRVLVPGGCAFQIMADTMNNYSPVRAGKGRRDRGNKDWSFRRELVANHHEKQPLNVPFLVTRALVRRGWCHRQTMIWDKGFSSGGNSGTDAAQLSHEYILYLFKPRHQATTSNRPYANCKGFNSSVLHHQPVSDPVHICPFPAALARELLQPCVEPGQTVLDPFGGSGTTAAVALSMGCNAITGDLKPEYCDRIIERCQGIQYRPSKRQQQLVLGV